MAEDVARMSFKAKAGEAILRSGAYLPASARGLLQDMVKPESLAIICGTLVVWAASHFFGVGEIVDILLLVAGVFTIGLSAKDGIREAQAFAKAVDSARTEAGLDVAARHFARAATILGLDVLEVVLLKGQARGIRMRGMPQLRPRIVVEDPPPGIGGRLRVSRPATLGGPPGRTSFWGEIEIARDQPLSEQRITLLHELVHRYFSPRMGPLLKLRVAARMYGYERSDLLAYLEEALAEGYAQLKSHGFKQVVKAFRYPLKPQKDGTVYVTISKMKEEGRLVGTIWLGGTMFWVGLSHRPRHP